MDQSVAQTITEATNRLIAAGIGTARLDAELLLSYLLKCERLALLTFQTPVGTATESRFAQLLARRIAGEPVAYITGVQAFWQHDFHVNSYTLIPRQDTETLVELALKELADFPRPHILDLGTGSGCILLSLLAEIEDATGVGLDVSVEALEIARKNASSLGLGDQAAFLEGNWFDGLMSGQHFDCIVANPPYIPSKDIGGLMKEVRMHEPLSALDGGSDGLAPYQIIAQGAGGFLKPGGLLAVEVGIGQAGSVADFFAASGFGNVEISRDLPGIDRVVSARKVAE